MRIVRPLIIIGFLFICQGIVAQNALHERIKTQAEKIATAVFNGQYDTVVKYTHPNIVALAGGEDALLSMLKIQMAEIENQGVTIDQIEVGDSIVAKRYKDEYHALVPKMMTMSMDGQRIMMKSYLFGFSDAEGMDWTFVEADELTSPMGANLFPDFETNIEIPKQGQPIMIDEFEDDSGDISLAVFWEYLEIDKRHAIETKLDKVLRANELGYCEGGTNGLNPVSEVTILLNLFGENQQQVMELVDQELTKMGLDGYDWLIYE